MSSGLPEPSCNLTIGTNDYPIGRVDLVYERFKVIIEYEGDQHRTDKWQWNLDIGPPGGVHGSWLDRHPRNCAAYAAPSSFGGEGLQGTSGEWLPRPGAQVQHRMECPVLGGCAVFRLSGRLQPGLARSCGLEAAC